MSWSYDITLPTAKDRVRLLIGDTDIADPLISDEEIIALLQLCQSQERRCAGEIAQAIAARLSRQADIAIGGMRENLSRLAVNYMSLANRLLTQHEQEQGFHDIAVHGVSIDEISLSRDNTDRLPSQFETAEFDNDITVFRDGVGNDRL